MPDPINLKGLSFENLIDPNSPSPAPAPAAPPATPPVVPVVVAPANPATPPIVPDPATIQTPPADPAKDPATTEDKVDTPLSLFKEALGYEVEGEFDEGFDGLIDYTRSAIPIAAKELINEIFQKYPQAEALIHHLDAGNSIDTFAMQFQKPEYVKVALTDKTDFNVLENIVKQDLTEKGYPKEDIDNIIALAKDKNALLDRAKKSQTEMDKRFNDTVASKKQAELDAIKLEETKAVETWNQVQTIVNSGKLPNVVIPDADKKAFLDFIGTPDEEGLTPRDRAEKEMSVAEMLYLDYLVFKGATKSKNPVDSSRKSLYDSLLGERNTRRMDGSGDKTKAPSTLKDPKNALKGLEFNQLIG